MTTLSDGIFSPPFHILCCQIVHCGRPLVFLLFYEEGGGWDYKLCKTTDEMANTSVVAAVAITGIILFLAFAALLSRSTISLQKSIDRLEEQFQTQTSDDIHTDLVNLRQKLSALHGTQQRYTFHLRLQLTPSLINVVCCFPSPQSPWWHEDN